ncbi:MAG: uroporphyrinogen decarboxylase family protein [Ignavibacteriaceae bacterium]|nr:uroporphyrinogen decarboxylase family protein [Ignavibacteriaceae bacterium]
MVAALNGEPADKIPIMLHNFMVAAAEMNISMAQFRESPRLIAASFIKSVEKYDLDGVLVDIDTVTLAGSVGVAVDFPEREPARSHGGILDSLKNLKSLKPVSVENYKYIQIWLEAVRLLKDYFDDEIMIRGNCDQSPFSLASMMRGTELWMTDLYMAEPSQLCELLDYCTEATCQFIKLMVQTGAHMVSNGDSPAGPDMISPELYEQYALPYETRVIEEAHRAGVYYTLHICGNTSLILDKMLLTGADAFEIDYKTDTMHAFNILKDKATFIGNIDPSSVLALGTPALVREKTTELLNIFSKTNRFILNSGCALPSITPEANMRAFVETARNYK